MPIDRLHLGRAGWLALALLPLLSACETDNEAFGGKPLSTFGEANRQTMLAQVVDPDPHYDTAAPATSALHAAQAIDRYKADAVKKPQRISSTTTSGGGGSSGGSR